MLRTLFRRNPWSSEEWAIARQHGDQSPLLVAFVDHMPHEARRHLDTGYFFPRGSLNAEWRRALLLANKMLQEWTPARLREISVWPNVAVIAAQVESAVTGVDLHDEESVRRRLHRIQRYRRGRRDIDGEIEVRLNDVERVLASLLNMYYPLEAPAALYDIGAWAGLTVPDSLQQDAMDALTEALSIS